MNRARLTNRDQAFLSLLYDYGLMTTEHIRRREYSGVRATTVLRRLRKLEEMKLLTRTRGTSRGGAVWWLTQRGGSKIGHPHGYGHVNRNTLEHDISISDVHCALEEMSACQAWTSGHLLKRQAGAKSRRREPLVPDGIAFLRTANGVRALAIEVELSTKAKGRYRRVLEEYALKKSIAGLWYIVANRSIARSVLHAARYAKGLDPKEDWI